jgi:hypothetical protein
MSHSARAENNADVVVQGYKDTNTKANLPHYLALCDGGCPAFANYVQFFKNLLPCLVLFLVFVQLVRSSTSWCKLVVGLHDWQSSGKLTLAIGEAPH